MQEIIIIITLIQQHSLRSCYMPGIWVMPWGNRDQQESPSATQEGNTV